MESHRCPIAQWALNQSNCRVQQGSAYHVSESGQFGSVTNTTRGFPPPSSVVVGELDCSNFAVMTSLWGNVCCDSRNLVRNREN